MKRSKKSDKLEHKILIAPNSFKENLSSVKIAEILETEMKKILPENFSFTSFPLSDGGDGFLEVVKVGFATESLKFEIDYPYQSEKKLNVCVEFDKEGKRVFIESAKAIGLEIVAPEKRNPLELTSRGLGQLLKQIRTVALSGEVEVKEVVIGLGGSATQDLGLGALSEFGVRIFHFAKYIPVEPKFFSRADRISYNKRDLKFPFKITFAVDVDNPLLGEKGSVRTFAKQKGAGDSAIEILEKGFNNILRLLHVKSAEGLSGAAGGIAAGFKLLADDVEVIGSKKFIEEVLGLNSIPRPDILITGEGKLDATTLYGKAPSVVSGKFSESVKQIFFIAGKSEIDLKNNKAVVISLTELFGSEKKAKANSVEGLKIAARKILNMILEN